MAASSARWLRLVLYSGLLVSTFACQKASPVDAITFDVAMWTLVQKSPTQSDWHEDGGDELHVQFVSGRPNLPAAPSKPNEAVLRDWARDIAIKADGALISTDSIRIGEIDALKTIIKVPQKPTPFGGMTYEGIINIPFADLNIKISIRCVEKGMTGARDAEILDRWLRTKMKKTAEGSTGDLMTALNTDFRRDPYDPTRRDGLMRNSAEDEQYDAEFPDHPLSRVRRHLARIVSSMRFEPEALKHKPFQ